MTDQHITELLALSMPAYVEFAEDELDEVYPWHEIQVMLAMRECRTRPSPMAEAEARIAAAIDAATGRALADHEARCDDADRRGCLGDLRSKVVWLRGRQVLRDHQYQLMTTWWRRGFAGVDGGHDD